MNGKSKVNNIMLIALIGVLGALCFAANYLYIPLPPVAGTTPRIHAGNIMCLLSGLILGPWPGGIAAGLGNMFFDLTNPLYVSSAPFTLVFKFLMAWVCGKLAWAGNAGAVKTKRNYLAAAIGQLTYIILYLAKDFITNLYFDRKAMEIALASLAQKGLTSTINGVIAVACAIPLAFALRKALDRAGLKGIHSAR